MITVDGEAATPKATLLETCRAAGREVPSFCWDGRVSTGGHCRACMVEVDGRLVASCATAPRDGMRVETSTPRLHAYRQDLGELMLADARLDRREHAVERTIASWGATGERYAGIGRSAERAKDATHPFLRIDLDRCIACRLCLRACDEIQGRFVYAMSGRGRNTHVIWSGARFDESGCVACGACAALCPTGAITDVDRLRAETPAATPPTRTTCGYCGVGCQMDVHVGEDRVLRVEGAPSPVNRGHLCVKGRYAHAWSRHEERLTSPLIRKNGALVPATWEEAIRVVADGFTRLRGRVAGLSSSRCTNEENYLFQKWFRAGLGTHDVDCCARVCHAPSAAGMRWSFGAGAATSSLSDIELADAILVVGSNTTEAHPVTGARVEERALGGTKLVVIDPRKTELAGIADVHLQVRPGANVPLLNALAHVLVEEDLVDRRFVDERTEGYVELEAFLRAFSPEATEATTGVPSALVRRAARIYGNADRPLEMHGLGVTEHHQGTESVMLLCNLALLAGAVGRPGAGVNPLRGQNNVQGAADMGCQPDSMTGYADPNDPETRARFARVWGRPVPTAPGRTLPRMYDAIRAGEIRGMFILGEDVAQTDPNTNAVRAALAELELLVVQEIFLSTTAELADVVLPGASFLEKDGTFTNGERRVQRVRRALSPVPGAKADWEILCELMRATGLPQSYARPADIMDEIAEVAPMLAGVSYARLEGDGLQWPVPARDHPGTAVLHATAFARGRARFACVDFVPSPALAAAGTKLLLTTGRALAHYNAGTMTRRTDAARIRPRDILELHADDAHARGIETGDLVRIESAFGSATAVASISDRIAAGSAFLTFHFPETGANLVTSDVTDRITDCPEYKVVAVDVARSSG